jgi:hypothetical protein
VVVKGGGAVVYGGITRGLQRSASASTEKNEGTGPSPPLGGAIVDNRGLFMVMAIIGGLLNIGKLRNAPLWQ